MENQEQHFQDLHEIRSLMERSARFISLSGLSGVCAGCFALIGVFIAFRRLDLSVLQSDYYCYYAMSHIQFIAFVAAGVLFCSLGAGIFFTTGNAKKKGQKIFDKTTWLLLVNLAIPLA